ncbi:MAG: minichromosome maintenance protein MCM [Methanobacteriota archaeon]
MEPNLKDKLEDFLHRKDIQKDLRKIAASGSKSLVVDFEKLLEFDKALAESLLDAPVLFLDAADEILGSITKISGFRLRVKGADKTIEIRGIRAEHVSKFIQIEGVMTRAGEVKPEAKEAVFKCRRCGEENRVPQTGDLFREPLFCENPNCGKKGPFDLVIENTVFRDWQSIQLQEPPERLRGGRMPRRLDCIVRDDFVDKAIPGNHVLITGALRVFQETQQRERKTTFRKILFVSHVEVMQKGVEEIDLTPEDEAKIKEMAKQDVWLRTSIIQSIAPAVHGHEALKEAVALQLFGCDVVTLSDGTRLRGDTHILLTGDPGTAKSQMLKWISNVAPRGIYTSGMKSTGAGITAAAVRDEISGGWTLEAGALVIADGGIACIDEFEKMRDEDRSAILESMEQQTISVAKAGIMATLNTRTAILAASNPKLGRFNKEEAALRQLALDPVILSRFDLVFIMRDEPRTDYDRSIAQHVLQLYSAPGKALKAPFDPDFLRKIVIYARKNINPKFDNKEAQKMIEDIFVDWRKTAADAGDPLPITVRQLEAIIRLAKANARLRLSDRVTVEDVNRAISLIKTCLRDAGYDVEKGRVDIDLIMTGIPRSQRDKHIRLMQIIEELEEKYGGAAPLEQVFQMAEAEKIERRFVDFTIAEEKKRGHLYEPKQGMVSRAVK